MIGTAPIIDTGEPTDADQKLIDAELRMIQMRDERNAMSQNMRFIARQQHDREYFRHKLEEIGRTRYKRTNIATDSGLAPKKTMIVTLADTHFGSSISGWHNEQYDADIAKSRMWDYQQRVFDAALQYGAKRIRLVVMGDLISGMIHKSIQVTNRENVIDQVMIAGEAIADFIFEMADHFEHVDVACVPGNHSRLDKKRDAMNGDRLDKLVMWYAKGTLAHFDDIISWDCEGDTLCEFLVDGQRCIAVHGDYDEFSDTGCARLISFLGYKPAAIFYAHRHRPSIREFNGVTMIQTGSFCGSGDELTERGRMVGSAYQVICTMFNDSIEDVKFVKLS